MTDTDQQSQGTRLLREPLVHFLVLAGLLFAMQAIFVGDRRQVIAVDAAAQEFLFKQQEDLLLRPLSETEKAEIVQTYVEEEILVREAVSRGFTDSSRVRTLLVQNMRFFIAGEIPDPTDEELKAWFENNSEQFESPPSLDLEHILFNDPDAVPADILERLDTAENPSKVGDFDVDYGYRMRFLDRKRLVGAFGPEGARQILAIPEGDDGWIGPILSPRGPAHFVRVTARHEPRIPEFDVARNWIGTQWISMKNREAMDNALDDMRPNYRVEIAPLAGDDKSG